MNNFGLTIIIPVYNTEKYLVRCLDSVKSLTFPIHVILVDDGSTDKSGYICDRYVETDDRFQVIHQRNVGQNEARLSGVRNTKTNYFTFIDSDDYIDTSSYENMLNEVLPKNIEDVDIICTGMTEEYLNSTYIKSNFFDDGIYLSEKLDEVKCSMLSHGCFFGFGILPNAVCKIYKTDFVRSNPYRVSPDVRIGEDADMTYQLLLKANRLRILNAYPYHYCRRADSMMFKPVSYSSIDHLELDLQTAFDSDKYKKYKLMNQLKDYIDFISLLCDPGRVLDDDLFFASKTDRIALYGAGGVGRAVKSSMNNFFSVWVDRNHSIYGDEIEPVDVLITQKNRYDKIFIANSNISTCKTIMEYLIQSGIDKPIYYLRKDDQ